MDNQDLLDALNNSINPAPAESKSILEYDLTGTPRDFTHDSSELFDKTRQAASDMRFGNSLMSIAENLNKNLNKVDTNPNIAAGRDKQADWLDGQYKAKQEQESSDLKLSQAKMDLDTEKDRANPASGLSNLYRNFLKERLKIAVPDDTSAKQLEKMFPILRSMGLGNSGQSRYQFQRITSADGTSRTVAINQNDPTDIKDIGESGFKIDTRTDPRTGELINISGSSGKVTKAGRGGLGGENNDLPKGIERIDVETRKQINNQREKIRSQDTFKGSERTLSEIPTLRVLLQDAKSRGGQSLAMLGPKIAKAIAGETGVLTDNDVTRYVQNPALVGKIKDYLNKNFSGRISEESAQNLARLLEQVEKGANEKMNNLYKSPAIGVSRSYGISPESARYYLDSGYMAKSPQEMGLFDYDEGGPMAPTPSPMPMGAAPAPRAMPQPTPNVTPVPTMVQTPSPNERVINGVIYIRTAGGWAKK